MKTEKIFFFGVCLVCLLFLASGLSSAAEPIKFGMTGALSGPGASLGLDALHGMEMAVKDINARGGINGHLIEIVSRDDEYDPSKALTFAKEMVYKEGVVVFFPSTATTPNLASEQVTLPSHVPHIIAGTTSDIVCPEGRCDPYAFRLSILNSWQAKKLAAFAVDKLKAKKIAIMYDSTEYGQDGRSMLVPELARLGITPIYEGSLNLGDVDFTAHLTKINSLGANAIITWTLGAEVAHIALDKKKLGYGRIPLLGSEAITMAELRNLAKEAANGIYIADRMRAAYSDPNPKVKEFMNRYLKEYKTDPKMGVPSWTITYYDAVNWVAQAIQKVGSDRTRVRDALENSGTFVGVTGIKYTFGRNKHNGRGPEAVEMVMVKDGKLVDPVIP
jgi:branched-chain amino acid transport system substrate-binding protein